MAEDLFDIVVIGSGPGGYVAAIKAAQLGLKVACVEKYPVLGGTCLNVGCIPSKALLHGTELYYNAQHHAKDFGINAGTLSCDFSQMMKKKESVVKGFNQGISGLFKKNKVKEVHGLATFVSENEIEVASDKGKQKLKAKNFILATGSKPTTLNFLDIDEQSILTSTGILSLEKVPDSLIVIGAGVIGVELGSVYSRLGSKVTFIEFLDSICPGLDSQVSKGLQKDLEKQGMAFHLKSKVIEAKKKSSSVDITYEISDGSKKTMSAEKVLVCIGRRPFTDNLGLETIGVKKDERGFVTINKNFQTNLSHIYAIGDIVDGPMLAHKAEEEGVVVSELIAGHSPKINYLAIPSVVYTNPEVGVVGLSETRAKELKIDFKTAQFPLKANSRARCVGEDSGFVKVLVDKQSGRLLGAQILSPHAGELIAEATLAIQKNMTAKEIAETCHAHPTLSEAFKEACMLAVSKAIHI